MPHLLILGILLASGYLFGAVAARIGLPKVTGYLMAGILLSPEVITAIPTSFVADTSLATDLALAFITFEVGGTLHWPKLRRLGRSIIWVTAFEAELAFVAVAVGTALLGWWSGGLTGTVDAAQVLPFALVLGALASPTDPSATLAVAHEYRAAGPVTDTVMGVAALDDVLGIVNFALAIAASQLLLVHGSSLGAGDIVKPLAQILGVVAIGVVGGVLLTLAAARMAPAADGSLIVVVLAGLCLVYGVLLILRWDALLGTMAMGCTTVNLSRRRQDIFGLLERYTEEVVFVLFFTLSGMRLSLHALWSSMGLVLLFVLLRTIGKLTGTRLGARIGRAPPAVGRHAGYGLLPQGGIVIGLALTATNEPGFAPMATDLLGIVIGATVVHEFLGPVLSRTALRGAGEITSGNGAPPDRARR